MACNFSVMINPNEVTKMIKQYGKASRDLLVILLICACTASAINQTVRIQVRRAGTSRITPRPMRKEVLQ